MSDDDGDDYEFDLPPPPPLDMEGISEDDDDDDTDDDDGFDLPPPPMSPPPPPVEEPSEDKRRNLSVWLEHEQDSFAVADETMNEALNSSELFTQTTTTTTTTSSDSGSSRRGFTRSMTAEEPLRTGSLVPKKKKTRRRSSVMDLVNQFRRGSIDQMKQSKDRQDQAKKKMGEELAQIAPSLSPRPSLGSPTSPRSDDDASHAVSEHHLALSFVPPESPEEKSGIEWKEMKDPSTGHTYWWNVKTRESSWSNPTPIPMTTAPPLEDNIVWTETQDQTTGRTYWFNSTTNESTWTSPFTTQETGGDGGDGGGGGGGAAAANASADASTSASASASTTQSLPNESTSIDNNDKQKSVIRLQAQISSLTYRLRSEEDARLDETQRMSRRMSTLMDRATNSISLEEHRKSMQSEGDRVSNLLEMLTQKNDELHRQLNQLTESSTSREKIFHDEIERMKQSTSITTISMKDERMNDMEDELATALSQLEHHRIERQDQSNQLIAMEESLSEKEEECHRLEQIVEELTPKNITEEEKKKKLKEEKIVVEQKNNEQKLLRRLLSCVEYVAQTNLPALESACSLSQSLQNVLRKSAPRALRAATEDDYLDVTGRDGGGGGIGAVLRKIIDDKLAEQERRHRAEVMELEKTSEDAMQSMARGWADAVARVGGSNSNNNMSFPQGEGAGSMKGQGPQVELFIWKAAMKVCDNDNGFFFFFLSSLYY